MPDRKQVLARRSHISREIRDFFHERGFTEVDTPVRIPAPPMEPHIDAEPAGDAFLRTSPELHMKRLLAEGFDRIFQMGPCFRAGERGHLHNPEFTMLEWYCAGACSMEALADTQSLICSVAEGVLGATTIQYQGQEVRFDADWERFSVRDAFRQWADWDPIAEFDSDRFDLDMVGKVEPNLPRDRPVVLYDYPCARAALARLNPDDPMVADRWELYAGGMELANAYGELTDMQEQRARFDEWAAERQGAGKPLYPVDETFLDALQKGLPPCAGVALGVDRLVMILSDSPSIDDVIAFR